MKSISSVPKPNGFTPSWLSEHSSVLVVEEICADLRTDKFTPQFYTLISEQQVYKNKFPILETHSCL